MSTGKLVLNHKATIVPAHDVLKMDGKYDEDYILVMSESRNPPRSIPRELALLLLTLRKPATVVEAVITVSRTNGGRPNDILERFYLSLPQLIEQHYLEYVENAEDWSPATDEQDTPPPGFIVLRVLNRMEDTEVLLVHYNETTAVLKRARMESNVVAQRLAWEAQILERLKGSVAPNLLSANLDESRPYLIMEAIPGLSLWEIRNSQLFKRWETDVYLLVRNILRAYRELHELNVIHSDVHPRNVLVEFDGKVRLIDFEYAGFTPKVEHSKAVGITPYFAPEVATAELKGRVSRNTQSTDQYSVAAVLIWLITGQYHIDFAPDARKALEQILEGNLRDSDIAQQPGAVLKRALALRPEDRYASMIEFEADWEQNREAFPLSSRTPTRERNLFKPWAEKMKPGGALWTLDPQPPQASLYFGLAGSVWALVEGSTVLDWDVGLQFALPWLYRLDSICLSDDAFIAPERGLLAKDSAPCRLYHDKSGVDLLKILINHRLGLDTSNDAIKRYAGSFDPSGPTELTDGLSGYLYGCVLLELMGKGDAIRSSANSTFEIIQQRIQEKLNSVSLGYLGMAHGIAGECYSLMAWCLVSKRCVPDVVSKALEMLENRSIPVGYGYEMPISDGVRDSNGASWCHGAGGYIYLWRIAARVLHDPRFLEHAEMFARTVWAADWSIHQLCCGSVGGVFAVAGLANELGDSRWDIRVRAMSASVLQAIERTQDPVSLFKGQAGGMLLGAQIEADAPLIFPLCGEVLA